MILLAAFLCVRYYPKGIRILPFAAAVLILNTIRIRCQKQLHDIFIWMFRYRWLLAAVVFPCWSSFRFIFPVLQHGLSFIKQTRPLWTVCSLVFPDCPIRRIQRAASILLFPVLQQLPGDFPSDVGGRPGYAGGL